MKYLLPLLILINCHEVKGVLEWTVVGKVTDYGQNVTLFCHVPNCCPKDAGWDRWTPNQRTLFIDVKTGRPNKKYDGKVEKDGYTLVIQNLTKNDLNVSYSCLYGVTLGEQKYLLAEDVFTYKSTAQPNVNNRLSEGQVAGIIVGVLVAVALSVGLLIFHFHTKKKGTTKDSTYKSVSQTDKDVTDIHTNEATEQFNDKEIQSLKKVETDIKTNEAAVQHKEKDCFLQNPTNVECMEGDDAILKCEVKSGSTPVKWSKDGKEMVQNEICMISNVTSMEKSELQLTLKKAKTSDSGEYIVEVGMFSRKLLLNVKDCFLHNPTNVECMEGDDAILKCEVMSGSTPVKWSKNGKEMIENEICMISNVTSVEKSELQLTLKKAKSSDSGEYIVEVGKFSRKMMLKIKEIPNKDEKTRYMEAIQYGKEVREYVRIQVIGKDRVGKTSLVRRLLGKGIYDGKSTDGIDIDKTCLIRKSDCEWIVDKVETDIEKIGRRILEAVNMKREGTGPVSEPQGLPDEQADKNENQTLSTDKNKLVSDRGKKPTPSDQNKPLPADAKEPLTAGYNKPLLADVNKPLPADKNKKLLSNEQTDVEEALAVNVLSKKNDFETKYVNSCSGASHTNPNDNKSNITDTGDTSIKQPVHESPKAQDHAHLHKDNQITDAIIENMADILLEVKNKKDNAGGLVECGIWDFAGQKDYYVTHQTFFIQHAIYLLVSDITAPITPIQYDQHFTSDSSGEYIDFWLDSIHCVRDDTKKSKGRGLRPPVIMVVTGIDKCTDEKVKIKEYETQFRQTFGRQEKGDHKRGEIHFISNTKSPEEEFKKLQQHISNIAQEMGFFAEELPTKWIELENALAVLKKMKKKENRGYCERWENIEKLAQKIFLEEDELILFLNYQHKIGNVIFFEDQRDYIVLEPSWLVDCFRCLVCDNSKKDCSVTELYKLTNSGELSDLLIDDLFKKVPTLRFEHLKKHILDVMEKFDIIVKPKSIDSYYMPCMIETSSTLKDIQKAFNVQESNCSPWLVLEFKFLPIAYANSIMFNYIKTKAVCKERSQTGDGRPSIFAGKAIVYLDETESSKLAICFSRNAISLQIWKYNNKDVDNDTKLKVIENLCNKIKELETKLSHQLQYNIKSKCSSGDYCSSDGRISYEELKKQSKQYFCEEHQKYHNKIDMETTWLKHAAAFEKKKQKKEEQIKREEEKKKHDRKEEEKKQKAEKEKVKKNQAKFEEEKKKQDRKKHNKRKKESLSENDRQSFMEIIQTGREVRKYVRIQVIGKDRVGKTSLVRRLLNQDLGDVKSTDGIDISRKCHIKESDGTWIFDNDQTEVEKIGNRILHAVQLQQMDNETNNDERLIADLNSFETEKNETPKYDIMLTVDETKQHLSDWVTDASETLNTNETVEVDDNDPKINTNYNADHITEAMVDKMDEIALYVKNKKERKIDKGLVECGIWDFAGQKEYYQTHQTFLTPHAIYLLVADITDDFTQRDQQLEAWSSGAYIDFWLDSIHCYCKDIKDCKGNAIKTSVIMVFTGIDRLQFPEKYIKFKTKEYEYIFGRQENGSHIRSKVHFISNINSPKEDFRNLREHISEIAMDMDFFVEELPTKWIQLENTLEILKDVNGYCEKLENIEKLAKTILIGKEELLRFLNYQHKIGNVIFFYDKCEYIILQPNWLVSCFRCLICYDAEKFCTESELYDLHYRGILSDNVIDKLFSKVPQLMFRQYKTHILEVMEKFDIIVQPISMNSYYIPCMITEVSSLIKIKEAFRVENHHCTPWLVLAFTFLPIAYFNHILFMYIRKRPVCEVMSDTGEERPAIYAGKTVVYLDKTKQSKLVICFSRNAISLQIWNRFHMGDNTYQNVVAELCSKIVDLEKKSCHKLEYKIQSKCRTGDYCSSSGRISHEELNALCVGGQYMCKEHRCFHNKDDIENTWFKHLVNTVNSGHNTSGEAAEVQEEQDYFPGIANLPNHPIEIKESTAESTDEKAPEIKSVNFPKEIVSEPNRTEIEEDLLDARCITDDAAKYSNTKLITAQKDVSSDLEQKLPLYSEYESMDKRLNSFESWSSLKKPTREDLARAGFFYSGKGDKVKCFFCAGILSQWKELDVPIDEHKRFYPACPFIKNIGE